MRFVYTTLLSCAALTPRPASALVLAITAIIGCAEAEYEDVPQFTSDGTALEAGMAGASGGGAGGSAGEDDAKDACAALLDEGVDGCTVRTATGLVYDQTVPVPGDACLRANFAAAGLEPANDDVRLWPDYNFTATPFTYASLEGPLDGVLVPGQVSVVSIGSSCSPLVMKLKGQSSERINVTWQK